MSLRDKFLGQKQKLENLCNEHGLSYNLNMKGSVVTLTLRPLQGAFEQLSLLEQTDGGGRISQDAYLKFWEDDGEYGTETFGTFSIGEALMGKFKNVFKKLDMFYCQFFRKTAIEADCIRKGMMPSIESDADTAAGGADQDHGQPDEGAEIDAEDLDLPDDEEAGE